MIALPLFMWPFHESHMCCHRALCTYILEMDSTDWHCQSPQLADSGRGSASPLLFPFAFARQYAHACTFAKKDCLYALSLITITCLPPEHSYFSGTKKFLPKPTDLSFYNWATQTTRSNASPNYQVGQMHMINCRATTVLVRLWY